MISKAIEAARQVRFQARLLRNPALKAVHQRGGAVSTFLSLNKPWFHALEVQTVLDIGANAGQFAVAIGALLPKASIYSFEPLPDCFAQLQSRMKDAPNFVAFNIGLGDEAGELSFERNQFSPASSFLKMTDAHKTAFPFADTSKTVTVKVECLDTVAERITINEPLMIKIDVQGYEDRVLRGGERTLSRAKLVIVETSFTSLYEGQPMFDDIYQQLVKWGFCYAGTLHQIDSPQNGSVLQADSIFMKHG